MMKLFFVVALLFSLANAMAQNTGIHQSRVISSIPSSNNYDVFAKFSFGDFREYVVEHIVSPKVDHYDGPSSTDVCISIDKSGQASFYYYQTSLKQYNEINDAFIKTIKSAPKWAPATAEGKPVAIFYTMRFKLNYDAVAGIVKVAMPPKQIMPDSAVSTSVDINPSFTGGEAGFNKYAKKNIHYSSGAISNGTQDLVVAQFIVEKDGSLSDIKILVAHVSEYSNEAIRILKLSPKWNPGIFDGVAVRVQHTMFIHFKP